MHETFSEQEVPPDRRPHLDRRTSRRTLDRRALVERIDSLSAQEAVFEQIPERMPSFTEVSCAVDRRPSLDRKPSRQEALYS